MKNKHELTKKKQSESSVIKSNRQIFEKHMEELEGDTHNITLPEPCPVTTAS